MADNIIDGLTRRIEALEKKYTEVNYPYQRPPYPCVVASQWVSSYPSTASDMESCAYVFLLSDGQIKFTNSSPYDSGPGGTLPTTLSKMAKRAGVEIAPADEKKRTVVAPKIFEKFGGMQWAYMGEFMVSDYGNLFAIHPETPQSILDKLEKRTADLGAPFKRDDSASDWDNLLAAFSACAAARKQK